MSLALAEARQAADAGEVPVGAVLVKDGVVYLQGTIPSWQGNSSRLHATRSVTGVRSIFNELRATTGSASAL